LLVKPAKEFLSEVLQDIFMEFPSPPWDYVHFNV